MLIVISVSAYDIIAPCFDVLWNIEIISCCAMKYKTQSRVSSFGFRLVKEE